MKINELIEMFEKKIGKQAKVNYRPAHPADMKANWASVEKARELLGWQPEVSLDEGVSNLIRWYQAERSWASQIQTE